MLYRARGAERPAGQIARYHEKGESMSRTTRRVASVVAALIVTSLGALVTSCHRQPAGRAATAAPSENDSVEVGYGRQARRDVTGAISRVDGDVARQSNPTSLADMLETRVPGLEVHRLRNGGVSVRIRGVRSLVSPGEPLYVIDGVPKQPGSDGILPDIDPRDIATIDVLRDAGSLAAYGSRGANGVILITLRRKP
jgi:TonB-dependent SusC/RagA subfamily outer membrane receptor